MDADHNLLGGNESFLKLTQLDPEQLPINLNEVFSAQDLALINQTNEKIISNSTPLTVEEELTIKGLKQTYLSYKTPLIENGQTIGIITTAYNISKRKAKEIERRKQDSQLKLALDNVISFMPGHVYWKDVNGVYLGSNDQMAWSLGLENKEDIIGKTDFDLPWPEGAAKIFRQNDLRIMETQQPESVEETTVINGKEGIVISNKVALTRDNNEIIGILGVSLDITERKQQEEALIAAREQAQIANQVKSDFIASMSHDLRTPLVAVIGIAELLKVRIDNQETNELIDDMLHGCNTILRLIKEILDFAKIDAGKLELVSEPMDLCGLIEGLVNAKALQANQKDIDLLVNYPATVPSLVYSDPTAIQRIVNNLLGNALKFTKQGRISINTAVIKQQADTATLEIRINDTGIGIPKEKMDLIFEKFYRAEPSYREHYKGVGLGLSIVSTLVEKLGGHIAINKEYLHGAEFIIQLPFQLQSKAAPLTWETLTPAPNILVVCDDPFYTRLLKNHLNVDSIDTCSPENIKECAKEGSRDLIIIYTKDNERVLNTAQHLDKASKKNSFIAVISKPLNLINSRKLRQAGINHIITAPVEPSELINKLYQEYLNWKKPTNKSQPENKQKQYQADVLLVEDNLVAQRVTKASLTELGCKVVTASSGKEALEKIKDNFTLAFLDMGLPDINGTQLAEKIRAQEKFNDIPLVALTGHILEEDRQACFAAGMDAFLMKPALLSDLEKILEKYNSKALN